MVKTKKKSGVSIGKMAIGAGVAAAAAGAGAYYFLGAKGKQHQKKAKILMGKIEKEIKKDFNLAKGKTKEIKKEFNKVKSNVKKISHR